MIRRLITFSSLALIWGILCNCGTYSMLRPADTLKQGEFEMTGGVAANSIPELVAVAQLGVGITDWLEFGAQYEVYSALGQLRFGLLNSADHGFALALAVGGGASSFLENLDDDRDAFDNGVILAGLTMGHRWDFFDLYLGCKSLFLLPLQYSINTVKLGAMFTFFDTLIFGLEGGATLHHGFWVAAEGAIHIGFKI